MIDLQIKNEGPTSMKSTLAKSVANINSKKEKVRELEEKIWARKDTTSERCTTIYDEKITIKN